jgi:hypothetical protein
VKFFIAGISALLIIMTAIIVLLSLTDLVLADAIHSASLGMLAALLFVTSGFTAFMIALKYRQKEFNKIVGISILGRLLLMAIILVTIFKFSDLAKLPFLIGMFASYFLFQIWELISFNRLNLERT